MDNLSHSLAGLAAAELLHRCLPDEADAESGRTRRRLLLVSCALASNFPDLDIILTPLLPAPLGYLLHHRGHTHTVLYALPQALLLAGLIWLLWPAARRLLRESALARTGFALAVVGGFGLHLLMDSLNSYGIHPFHPFDSRWYYGDLIFILEPVFWVALGVPLAMAVRRGWLRTLWLALLIAVPLYFTSKGFLAWTSFAALSALAVGLAWTEYRVGPRGKSALVLAFVAALAFIGMQRIASDRAHAIVAQAVRDTDPNSRLRDAALTAFPANPLCWTFVSVETNGSVYRLRRGQLSLAPASVPVERCPPSMLEPAEQGNATPAVRFIAEAHGELAALRDLKNADCHFEAWLRFARAPALRGSVAEDLRFARNPGDNFTAMDLDTFSGRPCPTHVPQWDFPRADLLGTR